MVDPAALAAALVEVPAGVWMDLSAEALGHLVGAILISRLGCGGMKTSSDHLVEALGLNLEAIARSQLVLVEREGVSVLALTP